MSIIFQTLGKLNANHTGYDPSLETGDALNAVATNHQPQRPPFRRALWLSGIIAAMLILVGFGAVLGIHYMSSTKMMPQVEASTGSNPIKIAEQPDRTKIVGRTENVVSAQTAPVYISPKVSVPTPTPQQDNLIGQGELPEMLNFNPSHAQQIDTIAVQQQAKVLPKDVPNQEENKFAKIAQDYGGEHVSGRMLDNRLPQIAVSPKKTNTTETPEDDMTYEQRRAEKAHRIAMQKSERINRLVMQLESSLANSPENDTNIQGLLNKLAEEKGHNSHYVAKMRAFWLLKQKKYEQAGAILNKLTISDEADPEVGINLVIIDLHKGDRQGALDRLQLLRKNHPDNTYIAELYRKLQ